MDQEQALKLYNDALDRLIKGRPLNVEKGAKINNDNVSLEAGRGKGSIKKSRPGYEGLIARIEMAALIQAKPKRDAADRVLRLKAQVSELEDKLDAALGREMSLVYELLAVRKELSIVTRKNVFPIRKTNVLRGVKDTKVDA
jgi:hypothetical protein